MKTIITGTGCYIPTEVKTNLDFFSQHFYGDDQIHIKTLQHDLIDKFKQITGIAERRYVNSDMNASDIAVIAARLAVEDAAINGESLDQIIVAHNFGNVIKHTIQTDAVPSLASRVKNALGIRNPNCVPYDLLFGCPGWLQGLIQADAYFKAGIAKKCLVVGTETLSRVIDIYDRDSMIFSDGAGACIAEAVEGDANSSGILGTAVQSHAMEEAFYINMGASNFPGSDAGVRYIKMKGRKVYEYALKHVPEAMKACLDKAGVAITDLKKIFIHQANEKMDDAILKAFYKLYHIDNMPGQIMPMNIGQLGNSSVATIPTLFDMVRKGLLPGHSLTKNDIVLFASVGAGMNINAVCYRM